MAVHKSGEPVCSTISCRIMAAIESCWAAGSSWALAKACSSSGVIKSSSPGILPQPSVPCALQNHSLPLAAVHLHQHGCVQAEMADVCLVAAVGLGVEPVPVDGSVVGVDGEVADVEGGQVLEEMAALRGHDFEVAQAGLDDHFRARHLIPCDRDAEPGIARAPASDADQDVRSALRHELRVETSHLGRGLTAAGA